MSATYDPTLPTDRDWVRFLIGDTDTSAAEISDEEINALLADSAYPNRYLAAAAAGDLMGTRAGGILSKSLAELSITYGSDSGISFADYVGRLRAKGADVELGKDPKGRSKVFRSLGGSCR